MTERLFEKLRNAPYPFEFEGLYSDIVIKQSVVEWDTKRNVLCWTHFVPNRRADNSHLKALVFLAELTNAYWAPKLQIDSEGLATHPIIIFKFGRDRVQNMAVKQIQKLSKNQIKRSTAEKILILLDTR